LCLRDTCSAAGGEGGFAGGERLLALVELLPPLVEACPALLRLSEPEADGLEAGAAALGGVEFLLPLLDTRERVGELALALLHLGDALGERLLQRGELARGLEPLPAQRVALRLDVGGLVPRSLQAHSGPMVLRRSLEPFLLAGTAHDVVALAEADARALGAVLVPEGDQVLVDLLDLVHDRLLAAVREPMPQLRAHLAQALDLRMNLRNRSHAS
jgi:hypothetical protein